MILVIDDRADKLDEIQAYWLACDAEAEFTIAWSFDNGLSELAKHRLDCSAIAFNCLTAIKVNVSPIDAYFAIRNIAPAIQLVITAGADEKLIAMLDHDKFAKLMQLEPKNAIDRTVVLADQQTFCFDYSQSLGEHKANIANLWRELSETKAELNNAINRLDSKLDGIISKDEAVNTLEGLSKLVFILRSNLRLLIIAVSIFLSIITGQFSIIADLYCRHAIPGTDFCTDRVDKGQ